MLIQNEQYPETTVNVIKFVEIDDNEEVKKTDQENKANNKDKDDAHSPGENSKN